MIGTTGLVDPAIADEDRLDEPFEGVSQEGPVFCQDCDNVHPDTSSKPPWQWLCMKRPYSGRWGFVTRDRWDDNWPPYQKCYNVNQFGDCEDFEPKREPPK